MSERDADTLPQPGPPMAEWVAVRDAAGREHRVPLRPDGAYIEALRRGAERRDARRPLEELLDELTVATTELDELRRAFAPRR